MRVNIGELGMRHMYEYYKSQTPNPLSFKEYKLVNQLYIREITELILKGENFRLPLRLGYLRVRKYKTDYEKLAKDYKTSKELGITIYHLNEHSDGYRVKYHWEKKRAILKQGAKAPYSFTLAREGKRKLASIMKQPNGHTRFPEEIPNVYQ